MSDFSGFSDIPILPLDDLVNKGDIKLGRGNIISKIDIRQQAGLFPIYSSSAKNNGKMGEYGKYMFDEEMITWSVDGGGNFFYQPKHKFSITNVSGYMRANQEKFDYKFLHAILDYQHSFLNFDYQTKAHPSVIRELYEIPIPPLPEQKKIAAILTSVDEVIENTEKQINKLQDLKKATMNELLTKGIGHTEFKDSEFLDVSLSEVMILQNDKNAQLKSSDYQTSGILPIIDQGSKYICGFTNDIEKKYSKPLPVIVFGDHTLHTKYIDFDFAVGADGTQIITTSNPSYVCKYLYYVINRETQIIGPEGYKRHLKILKERIVSFTRNIPEQKKIATILTSIDDNIEQKRRKLQKTQSLKKSLMQDLLTGKVRVEV